LIAAFWFVPVSIAISETFLSLAALIQLIQLARRKARLRLPWCLWLWLAWAALESVLWMWSPEPALGWSEIRHLLLLGVVFVTLSGFDRSPDLLAAWRGLFVGATASSLVLIGEFVYRLQRYSEEIAAGGDMSFYLRSGGLVHHWMIYGTIEVMVVAGLIAYWSAYPADRRWLWPLAVINGVAVVLSLTRMAWVTCLVLLGIHLIWKRSKWVWALPVLPLVLYAVAPDAVRTRVHDTLNPSYYSNSERVQMMRVGLDMIRDHPLRGVGPGRVEKLYTSYLDPEDNVPAYHGHLHNNLLQIAAQFGLAVTGVAVAFVAALFHSLFRARRAAANPAAGFLTETALLALTGFLIAGMFEYTYGHSLGLIMAAFSILPALIHSAAGRSDPGVGRIKEVPANVRHP
jgi:O-antigen ligase